MSEGEVCYTPGEGFNDETDVSKNGDDHNSHSRKERRRNGNDVPKKRKCGICMIFLFLITFGIMITFLVVGITTDGEIVIPTLPPDGGPTVRVVGCSISNSQRVANVLDNLEGQKIYVLELLNYGSESSPQQDRYLNFLEDTIVARGNGDVRLVYNFEEESWNVDVPRFTQGIVMEYANTSVYKSAYLDYPNLQDELDNRNNALSGTPVNLIATLNTEVKEKYPKLVSGPNGNVSSDTKFLLHLLKYRDEDKLDIFDEATKELKAENGIFVQAWLDVRATCTKPSSVPDYDQIRLETVNLSGFANVVNTELWMDASISRQEGIVDASGSGFADANGIFENLYE
eukprot:CAMPEP_0194144972 /NCGR_PEP_ID=MMETSP0152-20130528/13918_1 /TAXON_ID=1049557 /ORGANISM="Thalassiothrix antarctica, Strain L6-D1" /LENGTH=342 /DNA_ID=CAMNT_0038844997 /DNA_START=146 /DNA_END=1174 /DNA_ORIENTATION=-